MASSGMEFRSVWFSPRETSRDGDPARTSWEHVILLRQIAGRRWLVLEPRHQAIEERELLSVRMREPSGDVLTFASERPTEAELREYAKDAEDLLQLCNEPSVLSEAPSSASANEEERARLRDLERAVKVLDSELDDERRKTPEGGTSSTYREVQMQLVLHLEGGWKGLGPWSHEDVRRMCITNRF